MLVTETLSRIFSQRERGGGGGGHRMKGSKTTQSKDTPASEKGLMLEKTTTAVCSTPYLASKTVFKGGAIC